MKKRTLVLPTLAMLALIGCTDSDELDGNSRIRQSYRSREDCLADWNNKPSDCQYNAHHNAYFGPWMSYYMYNSSFARYPHASGVYSEASQSVHSIPSGGFRGSRPTITRSGFGSIGHGFSGFGS